MKKREKSGWSIERRREREKKMKHRQHRSLKSED